MQRNYIRLLVNFNASIKKLNALYGESRAIESNTDRHEIEPPCLAAEIPPWTPGRLRHNAATIVRRQFGLEAAQLLLGYAKADVTQLYAEVNELKAIEIAEKIG